MHAPSPIARYAERAFALDVRSLAALRMGLGAILLADLATRASDFAAMYTEAGVAPLAVVRAERDPGQWSVYLASGASWFQAAMFLVAAALAVALLVGYRTRLATIGSWAMLVSLHVRLPVVLNAGDTMLRVLLFWSMLLPLGAVWSLDARRRGPPRAMRAVSAATLGCMVQLSLVYWLAGWAKLNEQWLTGDALANVLGFGLYTSALGRRLLEFPELTRWLGRSVIWFELIAPCLLFVPWAAARLRLLLFAAMVAFHAGIAATVTVGLFSYVAIVAWLAILPSEFWERFRWTAIRTVDGNAPIPLASSPRGGWLTTAVCAAALALVCYWNAMVLAGPLGLRPVHATLVRAANALGLRQSWGLFGHPPEQDSWFVYQARLASGERIDLLTGAPAAEYDKPPLASRQFPNHRWRKLHWRARHASAKQYRLPLVDYFGRRWNEAHDADRQVVRLDLYCYSQGLGGGAPEDQQMRELLAQKVFAESGGNFAEAIRDLDP